MDHFNSIKRNTLDQISKTVQKMQKLMFMHPDKQKAIDHWRTTMRMFSQASIIHLNSLICIIQLFINSRVSSEYSNSRMSLTLPTVKFQLEKQHQKQQACQFNQLKCQIALIKPKYISQTHSKSKLVITQQRDTASDYFNQKTCKRQRAQFFKDKQYQIKEEEIACSRGSLQQQQNQSLKEIEQKFMIEKKKCQPLYRALSQKQTGLKKICIKYQLKQIFNNQFSNMFYYCICAYQLFEIISYNPNLTQVIIENVQITQMDDFIIQAIHHNGSKLIQGIDKQEKKIISCSQKFKSSWKNIDLSINFKTIFKVQHDRPIQKIKMFDYFCNLFKSVRDITVEVELGQLQRYKRQNNLKTLFNCLNASVFKAIRLSIKGNKTKIPLQLVGFLRQNLFNRLKSFISITQLSFSCINFDRKTKENQFLLIEQALQKIVESNTIKQLKLQNCSNFPLCPIINSLESVSLENTTFRTEFAFMNQLTKQCSKLKFVQYKSMKQNWTIGSQILLDQLQILQIKESNNVVIQNISGDTISELKRLQISSSIIGNNTVLETIFLKLVNLVSLKLSHIDFQPELLQNLCSEQLKQLHIESNNTITNSAFDIIQRKWPKIYSISIIKCSQIQQIDFSFGILQELIQLTIEKKMFGQYVSKIPQIKMKGIKIQLL